MSLSLKEIENKLFDCTSFRRAKDIDALVPNTPGFYCIKIIDSSYLPNPFNEIIKGRKSNYIYIGLATSSLKSRFLGHELRGKLHGTFFRSMGVVLGYRPEKGSLHNKKNKRNFKFPKDAEANIINWINENLLVNWVCADADFEAIETKFIQKHTPLFNLAKNPLRLSQLTELRRICVEIANS